MDARGAEINQTTWSLYSTDSVYLTANTVGYISRKIQDSCFQALLFYKNSNLEKHDSCGAGVTQVTYGSWIWPVSDSLLLQFAGNSPSLRNFRYTGDTLQLYVEYPVLWDSTRGIRIYPAITYIRF